MTSLSDLAKSGSTSSLASAASLDPSTAISNGDALFDNAYQKAGGSLNGTVSAAASVIAGLPAGPAKQMLADVMTMASGAAVGAEMGSVIPGWGTAVGAAVGAVVGLIESVFTSSPQPPEGEFRSTAEQYVFPGVQVTPGQSDAVSQLEQTSAQPASWPDIRIHSPGYQVPFTGTDDATGQNEPVSFTFGTSWVSPPGSTPQSKLAAFFLAQMWLGQSTVSEYWALSSRDTSGTLSERLAAVQGAEEKAWTLLGSETVGKRAVSLVSRWYGTSFSTAFSSSGCAGVESDFGVTPPKDQNTSRTNVTAYAKAYATMAQCLNKASALDFAYYFSNNAAINVDENGFDHRVELVPTNEPLLVGTGFRIPALPDTTLVGLCEIACLTVMGLIPSNAADHVALHYVLGLAWLWKRGQEQDTNVGGSPLPVANHPNFSRILGVITHATKSSTLKVTATKTTTTAKSTESKTSTSKASSSAKKTSLPKGTAAGAAYHASQVAQQAASAVRLSQSATIQSSAHSPSESFFETVALAALTAGLVAFVRQQKGRR